MTPEQEVRFGILIARRVYKDRRWRRWADNWLIGQDRSAAAADDASQIATAETQSRTLAVLGGFLLKDALCDAAVDAAIAASFASDAAAVYAEDQGSPMIHLVTLSTLAAARYADESLDVSKLEAEVCKES
jgi:hypothetical protein